MSTFQDFLVEKGWKRFSKNPRSNEKVYTNAMSLSTYGPTEYFLEHPEHTDITIWYGLHLVNRPPALSLSRINIVNYDKYRVDQDLWSDIMSELNFETIYNLIISKGTVSIENGKMEVLQ